MPICHRCRRKLHGVGDLWRVGSRYSHRRRQPEVPSQRKCLGQIIDRPGRNTELNKRAIPVVGAMSAQNFVEAVCRSQGRVSPLSRV